MGQHDFAAVSITAPPRDFAPGHFRSLDAALIVREFAIERGCKSSRVVIGDEPANDIEHLGRQDRARQGRPNLSI